MRVDWYIAIARRVGVFGSRSIAGLAMQATSVSQSHQGTAASETAAPTHSSSSPAENGNAAPAPTSKPAQGGGCRTIWRRRYTLVDHALARMERGLVGIPHAEGAPNPDIYDGEVMPGMGH